MANPHEPQIESHAASTRTALLAAYVAARADVLRRLAVTGDTINIFRRIWRDSVERVAGESIKSTAKDVGESVSEAFDSDRVDAYLDAVAENFAVRWADGITATLADLSGVVDSMQSQLAAEVEKIMARVVEAADQDAEELTRTAANFSAMDTAELDGKTSKTWHTSNDDDTRASHAALNGVTIPIDDRFANGLRFPKAPGPPQETVNCKCYLTFGG